MVDAVTLRQQNFEVNQTKTETNLNVVVTHAGLVYAENVSNKEEF